MPVSSPSSRTSLRCVAGELGHRRPALAVLRDPLARVLADRARGGRLLGGGELDPAGGADEVLHTRRAVYAALRRFGGVRLADGGDGRGPGAAEADADARRRSRPRSPRRAAGSPPWRRRPAGRRPGARTCGWSSARSSPTPSATAPPGEQIDLAVTPKPEFLCVQVTDDGPGLAPRPRALETDERRRLRAVLRRAADAPLGRHAREPPHPRLVRARLRRVAGG